MSTAAARTTIQLDKPLTAAEGQITQIVLREPLWRDIMKLGQPFEIHPNGMGGTVMVQDDAKIEAYAEALIVEPVGQLALLNAGVADTFKVRNAIIGFFLVSEKDGGD